MLAYPARVRGPRHGQHRVGVPHHDLHHAPGEAHVQQHRPWSVLAGVGDQLTDHQLREVHGPLRDRDAMLGLDPGQKTGGRVTGPGDVLAVPNQGSAGLNGRPVRCRAVRRRRVCFGHDRHPFLRSPQSPFVDVRLVEPRLVAEIDVDTAQDRGGWRHPVRVVRLRDDMPPGDIAEFGDGAVPAPG
ncbi:hypothetical protein GCM10018980_70610 [Streptomyces capoamus]|uniref:Uncharacterized protein n=1 Tax=Streptomyces capoamus TaxID=68183 RepID=A0A919F2R6_9ACTN|nr:hypothetical protein GCM10010501_17510 [Streptomyces libani subsp. rufus]GHG73994.1 hypothetical protein GCM10018980_70610 [Streptomyces capoamus]